MSTSDPNQFLPDVATLTRMANEFFRGNQPSIAEAPSMPGLSGAGTDFETRLPQVGMPMPGVPSLPSAGSIPGAPELTASAPGHITPIMVPGSMPGIAPDQFKTDPRAATPALPASPFSMPLPEFGASLFPSFPVAVPGLPALPPLLNEDDARAALTGPSDFYFLNQALPTAPASKAVETSPVPAAPHQK